MMSFCPCGLETFLMKGGGCGHRRRWADLAGHKRIRARHWWLLVLERAKDFRDWRAQAPLDAGSERAAGRAATRFARLLAWRGLLPPSRGLPPKGSAARTIGLQILRAIRGEKEFHLCCPPHLASRDRECGRQFQRGSRRSPQGRRRGESSRAGLL